MTTPVFSSKDFIFDVTIEGHENCDPEPSHYAQMANAKIEPLLAERDALLRRLNDPVVFSEWQLLEIECARLGQENQKLREALKEMLAAIEENDLRDGPSSEDYPSDRCERVCNLARAALAEAEG